MTQTDAAWSRCPDVAFVDDEERIVLLDLGGLPCRPHLLQGATATIWRLLGRPHTLSSLRHELEDIDHCSAPDADALEAMVRALAWHGLVQAGADVRS